MPAMTHTINHFINGAETSGHGHRTRPVFNPVTGQVSAELYMANEADVNATVAAAKKSSEW